MAEAAVTQLEPKKRTTHEYWQAEIDAANKRLEDYHKKASKVVKRYLGEDDGVYDDQFKLNFFYSNTKTLQDMLYSQLPKVESSRQHADAADDEARVASEVMERLINLDIAANGEEYDSVLRSCLQDRLIPGFGAARVRYEFETETIQVPEERDAAGFMITPEHETTVTVREDAPVEYYHWQDVLWGWGRSFAELPWIGFRAYLTRDEVAERFGREFVKELEFKKQKVVQNADEQERDEDKSPTAKAPIWEIWDKETEQVIWYAKGASKLLDVRPDPLGLTGFYPCPPFLIANCLTNLYEPYPDYLLAQDLYLEIDRLQTRIQTITEAVRVVGVYDSGAGEIARMLKEGVENDLIPVDSWAMFAEGGGLQGKVDWFPVREVADTLGKLQELRDQTIRLLQQITGMADVMQGQLNSPYEGVGQSQMKAQFGSVRVQALQDQFARFAGDLLQLKAEVICKHFDPETIIRQSNMQYSNDVELLPAAVQLLKSPNMAYLRIQVRPETIAMQDFGKLKAERTDFLNAFSTLMQSSAPLLEKTPNALPFIIQILQWAMAGFKGSQEIEGVLDKAAEMAVQEAQQQQQQPDPEQQKEQAKLQGEMQKIQAKSQADQQLRQMDAQADIMTLKAQHEAKMGEIQATHFSRMKEIEFKLQSDLQKEQTAVQGDLMQIQASADSEVRKDAASTEIEMVKDAASTEMELEKEAEKSAMEITKIAAQSSAKIDEIITQAEVNEDKNEQGGDDD
jgi:hypothetical protein